MVLFIHSFSCYYNIWIFVLNFEIQKKKNLWSILLILDKTSFMILEVKSQIWWDKFCLIGIELYISYNDNKIFAADVQNLLRNIFQILSAIITYVIVYRCSFQWGIQLDIYYRKLRIKKVFNMTNLWYKFLITVLRNWPINHCTVTQM